MSGEKQGPTPIKVDITKLIKVSTYAKRESISTEAARLRIKEGKVESVRIDGMTFVKLK
jgi:hypothetical protein